MFPVSLGLSVTQLHATSAERIEVPMGGDTWRPKIHCVIWGSRSPTDSIRPSQNYFVCVVCSIEVKWLAGVFAVIVAGLLVGIGFYRYRIIKRRRTVAAYENMRNRTDCHAVD